MSLNKKFVMSSLAIVAPAGLLLGWYYIAAGQSDLQDDRKFSEVPVRVDPKHQPAPCAACPSETVVASPVLTFVTGDAVRSAKRSFRAVNRPEDSSSARGRIDDEVDLGELTGRFRQQVAKAENSIERETLCREAFACGIDPSSLLKPVSGGELLATRQLVNALLNQSLVEEEDGGAHGMFARLAMADEVACELAVGYVRAMATSPESRRVLFRALRGIPSPGMVRELAPLLDDVSRSDEVVLEVVQLLGESRVDSSVLPLLKIVGRFKTLPEGSSLACVYLIPWAHRPDVFAELRHLTTTGAFVPTHAQLLSLWGVNGSVEAMSAFARSAPDLDVRLSAVRVLGAYSFDNRVNDALWNLVIDAVVAEEVRCAALRVVSRPRITGDETRMATLREFSEGDGALSEEAKRFVQGVAATSSERERNGRTLARAVRELQRLREIRERVHEQAESEPDGDRGQIKKLDQRIEQLEGLVERLAPEGEIGNPVPVDGIPRPANDVAPPPAPGR
jgi:hypothetical protein